MRYQKIAPGGRGSIDRRDIVGIGIVTACLGRAGTGTVQGDIYAKTGQPSDEDAQIQRHDNVKTHQKLYAPMIF